MQQALIRLKYLSGNADGIYGDKTLAAVKDFQKACKLTEDGLAGKKTLAALEDADKKGAVKGTTTASAAAQEESESTKSTATSSDNSPSSDTVLTAPDGGKLKLLHWYKDVKPQLASGNQLLVYDPSTGMSWTLRVHSCGRHCDAEPLTAEDTDRMKQAFGGIETWDQKGVYVKLPSGVWTVAATHDNPHKSGHIENNNFNGHLCVHFLRDLSEAQANDPNYGVSNQHTIRSLWRRLTGEDLKY
jgi:predicted secreted protein